MTTTYYTFRTRKVKVSGGPDLVTLVPEVQTAPAPRSAGEAKGEVLDFDFCRKHMETKNAWKALAQAAEESGEDEALLAEGYASGRQKDQKAPGKWQSSARLELVATMAVILVSVCASLAFLSLL